MDQPWLLFLHGINADGGTPWLEPLNDGLTALAFPAFPRERVITPHYRTALQGGGLGASNPALTWKRPATKDDQAALLGRTAALESRLRPLAAASPGLRHHPSLPAVPPVVPIVDEARLYQRSASVRAAVEAVVLEALREIPEGAQLVIVGHSLGSVVAAGLIRKLPSHLEVSLLLTLGSPLGAIGSFRAVSGVRGGLDDFPCDRIGAWVNVFDPRDPVTGSRGISEHCPWVIDLPVHLQDWVTPLVRSHGAEYYCVHPVTHEAIRSSLLGSAVAVRGHGEPRIEGLELLLLQSLYLRELTKELPTKGAKSLERASRLRLARNQIAVQHESAAALLHSRDPRTAVLPASEFLQRPDAYLHGAWDDDTLLALAIKLTEASRPADPFGVEDDWKSPERRDALVSTISLVRRQKRTPTDINIADAVIAARQEALDQFSTPSGLLPGAFIAAGVITLAATGVGLVAALPAGLAGAALITSTLAAFGPGGMVGGMLSLAALSGASGLMAGGGAGAWAGRDTGADQRSLLLEIALDEALGTYSPDSVRSLLVSLLTLVGSQERLEFGSMRDVVLDTCLEAKAKLAGWERLHQQIDPKADRAKAIGKIRDVLEQAIRWLRGDAGGDSPEARDWRRISTSFARSLTDRDLTFAEELALPGRPAASPRDRPSLGPASHRPMLGRLKSDAETQDRGSGETDADCDVS